MNVTLLRSFVWEVTGTLLLVIPSAVLADPDGDWFVEAGLVNVNSSRSVGGFAVNGEETGWQLGGGYAFNEIFSVKASYHALGKGHFAASCPPPNVCLIQNFDRVDIDGFSFSATASWPITSMLDVYGEVGILSWDTDFHQFILDESGEDLLYGVGLGVNFSPKWRFSLQYVDLGFDVTAAGIGLTHRFQ